MEINFICFCHCAVGLKWWWFASDLITAQYCYVTTLIFDWKVHLPYPVFPRHGGRLRKHGLHCHEEWQLLGIWCYYLVLLTLTCYAAEWCVTAKRCVWNETNQKVERGKPRIRRVMECAEESSSSITFQITTQGSWRVFLLRPRCDHVIINNICISLVVRTVLHCRVPLC